MKISMRSAKKGVSPVVSTVLLIMIVIIIAIIILAWTTSFQREAITKEINGDKKAIERWCSEIELSPEINPDGTSFGFTNTGNVPLYQYELKLVSEGSSDTKLISSSEGGSVNPGYKSILKPEEISIGNYDSYEEIEIIPILLGTAEKSGGTEEYKCPETYAKKI